jgi:hypothetical protein
MPSDGSDPILADRLKSRSTGFFTVRLAVPGTIGFRRQGDHSTHRCHRGALRHRSWPPRSPTAPPLAHSPDRGCEQVDRTPTHGNSTRRARCRRRSTTTPRWRNMRARRTRVRGSPATSRCASCQCRSAPSAGTTTLRRRRSHRRRCMRWFQPSGMRRDSGFQAVMSVAPRACRRPNSASGTRWPMRISTPSAR